MEEISRFENNAYLAIRGRGTRGVESNCGKLLLFARRISFCSKARLRENFDINTVGTFRRRLFDLFAELGHPDHNRGGRVLAALAIEIPVVDPFGEFLPTFAGEVLIDLILNELDDPIGFVLGGLEAERFFHSVRLSAIREESLAVYIFSTLAIELASARIARSNRFLMGEGLGFASESITGCPCLKPIRVR